MKRGSKPLGNVKIKWTPEFTYAIGLLVSDGCLYNDGRHISLTSKDIVQLMTFNRCLGLSNKIGKKYSGSGNLAYHVQFSDVLFYKFLKGIGLSPAKSKTIGELDIPKQYFFDFVRGYFDGDGCSYSFYDSVFKNSFRFYISFASGSEKYIQWFKDRLELYIGIKGSINRKRGTTNVQLKYSKREAVILAKKMYYHNAVVCLDRKRTKILKSLEIIGTCRGGEIGKHAAFRTL